MVSESEATSARNDSDLGLSPAFTTVLSAWTACVEVKTPTHGALTAVGLYVLGVPYAGVWSLLAAVMSLIPIFGTILSSAPMIGVSLFTTETSGLFGISGIPLALAVLAWILVIHFIETSVLEPNIVGKHAKIHPVLVLFALLAGEHFFGIPGLIFAVPVLSVVQTLFLFVKDKLFADAPTDPPAPTEHAT